MRPHAQTNNRTPPFGTLLALVTPFAMFARRTAWRLPFIPLPVSLILNVVQRALVYAFIGGAVTQRYQHFSCLHTLQDPRVVLGNFMGHENVE